MDRNKQHWDTIFKSKKETKPTYDLWLDKYRHILEKSKDQHIIDLGCGAGGDSLYLSERGYSVIACDYSNEALNIVNKFLPDIKIIQMDISKTLPFEDESIQIIIADLSLHYFNNETTKSIVEEIKRVLKTNGYLIGRVNSINDINYGAENGEEIEKNFYLTEEGYKRFFNKEDIHNYFSEFKIEVCQEESITKYIIEKKAFEFVSRK